MEDETILKEGGGEYVSSEKFRRNAERTSTVIVMLLNQSSGYAISDSKNQCSS